MKLFHLILALWALVAFLGWYQGQTAAEGIERLYTIAFYVTFAVSLVYLWRRIRARQPRD